MYEMTTTPAEWPEGVFNAYQAVRGLCRCYGDVVDWHFATLRDSVELDELRFKFFGGTGPISC